MPDQQQSLFDKEPEPWEMADQADERVATLVFVGGPSGRFDYRVPDELVDEVEPGRRVRAPLGRANRIVTGYCVQVATKPARGRPLKPLRGKSFSIVGPCHEIVSRIAEFSRMDCSIPIGISSILMGFVKIVSGRNWQGTCTKMDD